MISDQNKQVALDWLKAFNLKKLDNLLSLYHAEAEHYSPKLKTRQPETKGLIKGKDLLKGWWQEAFERLPGLNYELVKLTADEDQVFIEYIRHVPGEEDLKVVEVLEIKNGLIIASRVYHG